MATVRRRLVLTCVSANSVRLREGPMRARPVMPRLPTSVGCGFDRRIQLDRHCVQVGVEQVGVDVQRHRRRACPSIRCTALTLAPALMVSDAAVCRRSCGVIFGNDSSTFWHAPTAGANNARANSSCATHRRISLQFGDPRAYRCRLHIGKRDKTPIAAQHGCATHFYASLRFWR